MTLYDIAVSNNIQMVSMYRHETMHEWYLFVAFEPSFDYAVYHWDIIGSVTC